MNVEPIRLPDINVEFFCFVRWVGPAMRRFFRSSMLARPLLDDDHDSIQCGDAVHSRQY